MRELSSLNDKEIRDLLVSFTDMYSSIIIDHDFNSEEYYQCRDMIREIQLEIEFRQRAKRID